VITLSLFQNERMSKNVRKINDFPNRSFFAKKKRAIAHLENDQLPNPGKAELGNRSFSKEQLCDRSFCLSFKESE